MIVVSDTSSLTSLIQIGRLALLLDLYKKVLIPQAVHQELLRAHANLPKFIEVREVVDRNAVARLEVNLDLGEAEAIVLAKESKADLLLIDEKLGRQAAMREGVRITGLMGVLVEAKRQRRIDSLKEVVQDLETTSGFRVSDAVKSAALREAGE